MNYETLTLTPTEQKRRERERQRPTPKQSDESWRDRAACVGEDVDLFFPETQGSAVQVWNARRWFCDVCPVKTECGDYAIVNRIDDGVWGGMSVGQRRKIRREREGTPRHCQCAYRECRCP